MHVVFVPQPNILNSCDLNNPNTVHCSPHSPFNITLVFLVALQTFEQERFVAATQQGSLTPLGKEVHALWDSN